jgi:ElaA protein
MPDRRHAIYVLNLYDKKAIVVDNPHMKNVNQPDRENPELQWCWYRLEEMDPVLLYDMLALREAIFVVEQTCIYHELDGRDKCAHHLIAKQNDEIVAGLRILPPEGSETRLRIGRVAVSMGWRKRGLARLMMHRALEKAGQDYPSCMVCLDAQTYLQGFYETLGFRTCGDEFLEDGIPHIPMQYEG